MAVSNQSALPTSAFPLFVTCLQGAAKGALSARPSKHRFVQNLSPELVDRLLVGIQTLPRILRTQTRAGARQGSRDFQVERIAKKSYVRKTGNNVIAQLRTTDPCCYRPSGNQTPYILRHSRRHQHEVATRKAWGGRADPHWRTALVVRSANYDAEAFTRLPNPLVVLCECGRMIRNERRSRTRNM